MVEKQRERSGTSRRNVLQSLAFLSAIGVGPSVASAGPRAGPGVASAGSPAGSRVESSDEVTMLGEFESGFDGWKTNGGNGLSRIAREQRPFAVTSGTHGLVVSVTGDPFPMISNRKRTRQADWVDRPHLLADVTPGAVSDLNATLTFKFRLHHDASSTRGNDGAGKGNGRGKEGKDGGEMGNGRSKGGRGGAGIGGDGGKARKSDTVGVGETRPLVVESEEMVLTPHAQGQLAWDLGDVDDRKLERARRLDVVWYPTEHPPKKGPEGRGPGFEYDGEVTFDDIRLVESSESITRARLAQTWFDLRAEHGVYTDTVVVESGDGYERGAYVFDDGTHVPFEFEVRTEAEFEVLSEDELQFTIDGEAFEFGGEVE